MKMAKLTKELSGQFKQSKKLEDRIKKNLCDLLKIILELKNSIKGLEAVYLIFLWIRT